MFKDNAVYDTRRPEVRLAFGPLCAEARRARVDLGARGYFATPGIDFNRETGRGTPFYYFTQGAACVGDHGDRAATALADLPVLSGDVGRRGRAA